MEREELYARTRIQSELLRMAVAVKETNAKAAEILDHAADLVHASIRQEDALEAAEATIRAIASGHCQSPVYESKSWIQLWGNREAPKS